MRRPLRAAVVAVALIATSCGSYEPVQPLDDGERAELASFAPLMAVERVRVISTNEHATEATGDV